MIACYILGGVILHAELSTDMLVPEGARTRVMIGLGMLIMGEVLRAIS